MIALQAQAKRPNKSKPGASQLTLPFGRHGNQGKEGNIKARTAKGAVHIKKAGESTQCNQKLDPPKSNSVEQNKTGRNNQS